MDQPVVEFRRDRLAHSVQELHLHQVSTAGGIPLQPKCFLVIHQKTVSINAESQPPATVTITQVLEGSIPNKPIQKQWLQGWICRIRHRNKPWRVAAWLRPFHALP